LAILIAKRSRNEKGTGFEPVPFSFLFIASALTMLVNDRHGWDARSEYYDSSDGEPHLSSYLSDFNGLQDAITRTPGIGIHGEPDSHYWALRRGNETVAVVSMEGLVYRTGQPPQALETEYDAAGRRILPMTARLLRHWL